MGACSAWRELAWNPRTSGALDLSSPSPAAMISSGSIGRRVGPCLAIWAGSTHIVSLGPIRMKDSCFPCPPSLDRAYQAAWCGDGAAKRYSCFARRNGNAHGGSPTHPASAFDRQIVNSIEPANSAEVGPITTFVWRSAYQSLESRRPLLAVQVGVRVSELPNKR